MFKIQIDLTTKEVDAPADRRCASGHIAPEKFSREGPGTPALPIRFFRVIGSGTDRIFCEPCYTVAAFVASIKKNHKR